MLNKKVLIIDDQEDVLRTNEGLMAEIVQHVATALSGAEGLKLLENESFDCLVCDISMPEMSGLDLIKEIRKTNKNLPVIFYTGFGNEKFELEALKYGAFGFVHKPDFDSMLEYVLKALRSSGQSIDDLGNL